LNNLLSSIERIFVLIPKLLSVIFADDLNWSSYNSLNWWNSIQYFLLFYKDISIAPINCNVLFVFSHVHQIWAQSLDWHLTLWKIAIWMLKKWQKNVFFSFKKCEKIPFLSIYWGKKNIFVNLLGKKDHFWQFKKAIFQRVRLAPRDKSLTF